MDDTTPSSTTATEIESLLVIDEDNLANEWHKQPQLVAKASAYAARCEAMLLEVEFALKMVTSEVYLRTRDLLSQNGKKPTEEQLKHYIVVDEEVGKINKLRAHAVENRDQAQGLLRAVEQRAQALKWLCHRQVGVGLDTEDVMETLVNRATQRLVKILDAA